MSERGMALNHRRAVQFGILALLLIPFETNLLQASSVPAATSLVVVFATAGAVLALLVFLRVRIGREALLHLFPRWLARWPHVRLISLLLLGMFAWYLVGTMLNMGALYRIVYGELAAGFILELYAYDVAAPRERRGFRGGAR